MIWSKSFSAICNIVILIFVSGRSGYFSLYVIIFFENAISGLEESSEATGSLLKNGYYSEVNFLYAYPIKRISNILLGYPFPNPAIFVRFLTKL